MSRPSQRLLKFFASVCAVCYLLGSAPAWWVMQPTVTTDAACGSARCCCGNIEVCARQCGYLPAPRKSGERGDTSERRTSERIAAWTSGCGDFPAALWSGDLGPQQPLFESTGTRVAAPAWLVLFPRQSPSSATSEANDKVPIA